MTDHATTIVLELGEIKCCNEYHSITEEIYVCARCWTIQCYKCVGPADDWADARCKSCGSGEFVRYTE